MRPNVSAAFDPYRSKAGAENPAAQGALTGYQCDMLRRVWIGATDGFGSIEAARLPHAPQQRGGVAAHGAGTTGVPDAADRRPDGPAENEERQSSVAAFREELGSSGGWRAATARSTFAGRRPMSS